MLIEKKSIRRFLHFTEEPEKHAHRLTSRPLPDRNHTYSARKGSRDDIRQIAEIQVIQEQEAENERPTFSLEQGSDSEESEAGISFTVTPPKKGL